ncbi:MAG: rhomboid family intramembrane serine protease [Candidatus Competibacterales bacterium]|nr:rhomboid family intramembrane serine protease [Candidatus Competibacterales bacterium]
MFLPLHDKNPLRIVPFQAVTVALIVLNVLVFGWQWLQPPADQEVLLRGYGMIPAVLFDRAGAPVGAWLPAEATVLTYMFFHQDFWHLLGNMLFLWVFGDNIEDAMGHARFLLFYLVCGVLAVLLHALLTPQPGAAVVGASGAVAGVMGAYLLLHPRVKLLVLLFGRLPLNLPAWLLIGAWVIFQFFSIAMGASQVAWWAHVGGFVAGALLVIGLRDKRVPLLDQGVEH